MSSIINAFEPVVACMKPDAIRFCTTARRSLSIEGSTGGKKPVFLLGKLKDKHYLHRNFRR